MCVWCTDTQNMYTGVISNIHIHVWTSPTSVHTRRHVSAQPPHAHTRPLSGLGMRSVPCARQAQGQRFLGRVAAASRVSTGDFLLLLCASQQWQVFLAERTEEWQHMAGVNTDHLEPLRGEPNPVPNFIHCRWVPGCRQPAQSSLGLHRRRGRRAMGTSGSGEDGVWGQCCRCPRRDKGPTLTLQQRGLLGFLWPRLRGEVG